MAPSTSLTHRWRALSGDLENPEYKYRSNSEKN